MTIRSSVAVLFLMLCATAFSSYGGPVYQLIGGVCNVSNQAEFDGPLLCSHHISATVEMADGYVPGTGFYSSPQGPLPPALASLTFSDGFVSFSTDFPLGSSGVGLFGIMPGELHIAWFEGLYIDFVGGWWSYARAFEPVGYGCSGYCSSGTWQSWALVAEPSSLALIGVALAGLAFVRFRGRLSAPRTGFVAVERLVD